MIICDFGYRLERSNLSDLPHTRGTLVEQREEVNTVPQNKVWYSTAFLIFLKRREKYSTQLNGVLVIYYSINVHGSKYSTRLMYMLVIQY